MQKAHYTGGNGPAGVLHYGEDQGKRLGRRLLESADKGDFAVDAIDECLVLGVVNTESKNRYLLGEFDLKLFIHGIYVEPHLPKPPTPDELVANFKQLKLREWRQGFGCVVLFPLPERQLPDKLLMDVLLGRNLLKFFFNP